MFRSQLFATDTPGGVDFAANGFDPLRTHDWDVNSLTQIECWFRPASSKGKLRSTKLRQGCRVAVYGTSQILRPGNANSSHTSRRWHHCVLKFEAERLCVCFKRNHKAE